MFVPSKFCSLALPQGGARVFLRPFAHGPPAQRRDRVAVEIRKDAITLGSFIDLRWRYCKPSPGLHDFATLLFTDRNFGQLRDDLGAWSTRRKSKVCFHRSKDNSKAGPRRMMIRNFSWRSSAGAARWPAADPRRPWPSATASHCAVRPSENDGPGCGWCWLPAPAALP